VEWTTRQDPVTFAAKSNSDLGFAMLAAAEADRLKLYADSGNEGLAECYQLLAHVQFDPRANATISCRVCRLGCICTSTTLSFRCRNGVVLCDLEVLCGVHT
jgi:hypothetical protein